MNMLPMIIKTWGGQLYGVTVIKPPAVMGFDDAFSVCAITWATIFFLFLLHLARTKWMIVTVSLIYVAIQIMAMINVVYGGLDQVFIRPNFQTGIRIFWLAFGVLLMLLGGVYLRDWAVLRKGSGAGLWIGFPGGERPSGGMADLFIVKLFVGIFYMLLAALLGAGAVLSSAFTLQDYDVFIMALGRTQANDAQGGLQESMKYISAYLSPGILAALVALIFSLAPKLREIVRDRLVLVKLTFALIFLALGAGAIITVL